MLLANYQDFENGGLYDPPYRRYPFFGSRADWLSESFQGSFLIVGCGWGFLVDELRSRGREAWGCDLSDYAIRCAGREVPTVARFIGKANGLNSDEMLALFGRSFDVGVSEDVLTCLDNEGQVRGLDRAMGKVADHNVHIVTPESSGSRDGRVFWASSDRWVNMFPHATVIAADDERIA